MREEEYGRMRALEDRHWWYRGLRGLALRRIGSAARVLDVGCGTGGMLSLLGGRLAVGVDVSPVAVGHARERGGLRLVRGDACALPFRDGAFDAVLALDVIYHRAVESDGGALAECARVARPGGLVAVHVPAYEALAGSHDEAVHGVRRYTVASLRRLVLGAGLAVEELSYRNLAPLPAAAAHRSLGRGRPGGKAGSDLLPVAPWLDTLLSLAGRVEGAVMDRLPLPAGLSVWCLARRPA